MNGLKNKKNVGKIKNVKKRALSKKRFFTSMDQERFVSRWIPSSLNVETRSIAPDEVKRGDKLK